MAGGDAILQGLSDLQFSAADNPYGIGTATLAASLPKLISPTGNLGTNLGVALGGTLLTALMGYQARRQASELTSQATNVGLDILNAKTQEERKALAENADQGFYGPDIKAKALDLVTALEGQKKINEFSAQLTYDTKLKELEAQTSPQGEKLLQLQTDKMLQGIQERGDQQRQTEELKKLNKLDYLDKKAQIDAQQGWLKNDQKLAFANALNAAEVEAVKNGTDADTERKKILAAQQAVINKAKEDYKQQNDLQKIEFKSQLAKANPTIPQGDVEELGSAQDLTRRAYELANYIKEQSYAQAKLGLKYSAADDNSLMERMEFLKSDFGKLQSGKVISKSEWERLSKIIQGDITAGVDSMTQNLTTFADELANKSMAQLSLYGTPVAALYNKFATAAQNKAMPLLAPALEAKQAPAIPQSASAGMPSGGGLLTPAPTSAGDPASQVAALEAQATEIKAQLQRGDITPAQAKQKATELAAQRKAIIGY